MPGYSRDKTGNDGMVEASARETVMRREAGEQLANAEREGLDDQGAHELAQLYRRAYGETPQQAWDHAVDRWADAKEAEAATHLNEVNHDEIPLDENSAGKPYAGNGLETSRAEGRSEGAEVGGQPGGGRQPAEGHTNARPDGGRETTTTGGERPADRSSTEGRGEGPLRGGDDAFDPKSTLHSGAIFDPAVWKWMAGKLGFNEQYRREMGGLVEDFRKVKADKRGEKTNSAADFGRLITYSNDGMLRAVAKAYDSPVIKKIADLLHAPSDAGRGGAVTRTFHEELAARTGHNINALSKIMEKFAGKQDVVEQITKLGQNPSRIRPGTAVHDAAAAIAKLLDEDHKYRKKTGMDVGYVKGYFPREIDTAKVMANPTGFQSAAERAYRANGLPSAEAKEAAEHWLQRIMLGGVNVRPEGTDFVSLGGTPSKDFAKGRVLSKAADEIMSGFYHRDPLDSLVVHFQRTARRAAWADRFGGMVKGPDGKMAFDELGAWKKMKADMIKEGSAAAIPDVVNMIGNATGSNPPKLPGAVNSVIGWARMYGVLHLLPHATITSLSESLMPGIRSGNVGTMLMGMPRTVAALWKRSGELGEQRTFAEDLGLIMRGSDSGILSSRFNALDPTNRVQERIMNRFFRATMLEQYTAATRVVAVNSAETFIRRLGLDVADGKSRTASSKSLLTELGVKDTEGFSKWVKDNEGKAKGRDASEGGHAETYRDAVARFAQQAILAPSESTRPRWANHPIGSLVFMLQSYNYAFQKNVLNRALHQVADAVTNKEYGALDRARMLAPVAMLPALAAMQLGIAPIREGVFGTSGKKTQTDDDSGTSSCCRRPDVPA
jgi:hypothetical protein